MSSVAGRRSADEIGEIGTDLLKRLLAGHQLRLDFVAGGTVEITPLP